MPDDLDKPYFTKNNIRVRFERDCGGDASMFLGYMTAINKIMPGFLKLIEAAENFDDLKKKVIDYANEHIQFRDDMEYLRYDKDADEEEVDRLLPDGLKPF